MDNTLSGIAGEGSSGAAMMPIIQGIGRAAVEIAYLLRGAVFRGALGVAGSENVQGEQQQKLDILSDEIFLDQMRSTGHVCAVGSEEQEELCLIDEYASADWLVLVDPLDGSSNLDVDGPVGTIFSIVKRKTPNTQTPDVSDTLQSGRNIVRSREGIIPSMRQIPLNGCMAWRTGLSPPVMWKSSVCAMSEPWSPICIAPCSRVESFFIRRMQKTRMASSGCCMRPFPWAF